VSFLLTGEYATNALFGAGETNETYLVAAGAGDAFVARYDSTGALVWVEPIGGAAADAGWGVAALADGSPIVTGEFAETATFGLEETGEISLTADGGSDVFLARFLP